MNRPSTMTIVAAALLAAGAAGAQAASSPDAPQPSEGRAQSAPPSAAATVDADGVRHVTVASKPVPDTVENRARYGRPISRAGQRTLPAGD